MRTVILMRHAQAGNGYPDHARPLTLRGRVQAREQGQKLAANLGTLDAVLVSDARRTCETLEELLAAGLRANEVRVDPDLYDISVGELVAKLEELNATQPEADRVMLLGHEPTISATAARLASSESFPGEVFVSFSTASYAIGKVSEEPIAAGKVHFERIERASAH